MSRLMLYGLILAGLVVVMDQASKLWIVYGLGLELGQSISLLPIFNLTLVHNYGISLGLLQAEQDIARYALILVTVGIAIWLLTWLHRVQTPVMAVALGLIIGGAVGNIIDRVRLGYVIDFLHAHAYGWSFYIFNIADAAITIGVGFWLLDMILQSRKSRASEKAFE